jgi:hypothetical protein
VSRILNFILLVISLGLLSRVDAQILKNLELTPRNTKLIVSYQLVQDKYYPPEWRYDLSLSFIGKKQGRFRPKLVKGELDSVPADGKIRTLEWDAYQETGGLKDEVAAELRVRHLGGPEAAFCSVLLPGWGIYESSGGNRKVFHRAGMVGGALFTGWVMKELAYRRYIEYGASFTYAEGQQKIQSANRLNTVGTVFILAGLGYWLFDIAEAGVSGARNLQLRVTPLEVSQGNSSIVPAVSLTWKP